MVFRVSQMRTSKPFARSTIAAVSVAIPEVVCRKISATRSPESTARVSPSKSAMSSPLQKRSPSFFACQPVTAALSW